MSLNLINLIPKMDDIFFFPQFWSMSALAHNELEKTTELNGLFFYEY